jgi:hypothetical protein
MGNEKIRTPDVVEVLDANAFYSCGPWLHFPIRKRVTNVNMARMNERPIQSIGLKYQSMSCCVLW